jgi:1-acyl-sn-glycerol-3-phosphate acyltransferase
MSRILALLRLLLLAVVLLVLIVSWLLPLVLGPFSRRAASALRVRLMGLWARSSLAVMGVRVRGDGPPPRPPFLLVSNHLSYLDIMVLWSRVDAYFLGKSELGSWPLLGPLIRAAGTLFIDRNKRAGVVPAIAAVKGKLDLGNGVVFFPEGTSSSGGTLLPFKSSMFAVAVDGGTPVHVACLHYACPSPRYPVELDVAWWGDMGFGGHFLKLLGIPRIDARVRFAAEPVQATDRKQLAEDCRARMLELFEPMHDYSRVRHEDERTIPLGST